MTKKRIESKVLTVSEIAEEAGVSRNLVWSYIRNHKIKPIVKEKRKYKFDSDIVLKIKKKQAKKQANNGENKNHEKIEAVSANEVEKEKQKKLHWWQKLF